MERTPRFYDFGRFRLDVSRRSLMHGRHPVPLTARLFELLSLLLRERHRAVRRAELLDSLWPDVVVEDANLSVNISLLRKLLQRHDPGAHYIETLPKVGYRFCGEVAESCATDSMLRQNDLRWHACMSPWGALSGACSPSAGP